MWIILTAIVAWLFTAAGNISDYLEAKLLDHSLGKTSYTMPTTYVALFTTDPGEANDQTAEVPAARGYARQALTIDAASVGAGTTQNDGALVFGPCTGTGWGLVAYVAVVDDPAIGGGDVLWYGQLAVPKTVGVGDTLTIADAALTFALA